jgi:EpsI family protein
MSSVTREFTRAAVPTTAIALALFAVAIGFAYADTLGRIVPNWLQLQGVYSHGLLLVGLIGSLWWTRRAAILGAGPHAPALLVAIAFAASGAWFVGWLTDLGALQMLALFIACVAGGTALVARGAMVHFALPFALVPFALPMWATIVPFLQSAAARMVGGVLRAADLIVYIDGNQVSTPNGTFEIADSCSGLGFLLVALSITGYLALTHQCSRARLAAIVVASLGMGLLINWVRIVFIILAGYYGGMDHLLVHQHVWFGWVVFAAMYLPFLWFVLRFLGPPRVPPAGSGRGQVSTGRLAATIAATCGAPLAAALISAASDPGAREPYRLPHQAGAFERRDAEVIWHPYFAETDHLEWTAYSEGGEFVYAFAATYLEQTHGKEVVNVRNNFFGRNWKLAGRGIAEGPVHEVAELELDGGPGRRLLVWYWYRIGGSPVADARSAKLVQMRHKLTGRTDGVAIALAAPCVVQGIDRDCGPARDRLGRLAAALP